LLEYNERMDTIRKIPSVGIARDGAKPSAPAGLILPKPVRIPAPPTAQPSKKSS